MYTKKGTDTLAHSYPLKDLLSTWYQIVAKTPTKEEKRSRDDGWVY